MTSAIEQTVVPAATLVVFRNASAGAPEILFMQRARELSFAGSATVFPGGKVHPTDHELARSAANLDPEDAVARVTAIRETLEETGLVIGIHQKPTAEQAIEARSMVLGEENLAPVLDRFGWTLDLASLVPFARWLPTHKPGRVFDTRFYLADVGTGDVALSPDLGESTRLFWASANDARAMLERGEIRMIFPTRCNLLRLQQFASFAQATEHARATPVVTISPWRETRGGVVYLQIPDNAGYPVTSAPLEPPR